MKLWNCCSCYMLQWQVVIFNTPFVMSTPSSHSESGNTVMISFLYWPLKQPTIMVSYVFFSGRVDMTENGYRVDKCIYLGGHHGVPNICDSLIFVVIYRPFQEILRVWQNTHANSIRHAMVCDVYFSFSKIW